MYLQVGLNVLLFLCVDGRQTSESDVYRRQIVMSEVGPRTVIISARCNNDTKYCFHDLQCTLC